jgi:hypothetical protein
MDIKTSPMQRAQFKNFMRSMSAPSMPQVLPNIGMGVPSPDQTMAPMPTNPMMNIDIFSQPVQYMADGGYAGSGMERGRGGTGMGDVGFSGASEAPSVSGPSIDLGGGGGSNNDALSDILSPAPQQSFDMPGMDILGNVLNMPGVGSNLPSPIQGAMDIMSQGVTMPGPMGIGSLNIQPTFSGSLSDPNLGIQGLYSVNFEDGGAVTVPKTSDVRGMPHKLAYITEEEAGILKALGGTGEMHNGIPSYRPAGDTGAVAAGTSSSSGSGNGNGGGGANNSNNGGTAFGVDGVSATGSTATDAAIGFTSGEGTNVAGQNFGGLTGAPSSVVADAVSAAAQAAKGGGDLSAQQNAATNVISGGLAPDVAAVSALGGETTDTDVDVSAVMGLLSDLNIAPTQTEQTVDPTNGLLSMLAEESMMNDLNAYNAENQANAQAEQAMNNALAAIGYVAPAANTDLSAMIADAAASDNAYGISPTGYNLANQQTGYVSPVQSGQTGQYTVNGVPVSEQFAQQMIANQQQVVEGLPSPSAGLLGYMGKVPGLMSGLMALTGFNPEAQAAEAYGKMLAMEGAQVDEAGNITAPAGRGTLNYSQTLGGVTYSGMPDASYSGPFSGLVTNDPSVGPQGGMDVGIVKPIASDIQSEDVTQTPPNQIGGILDGGVTTPESNQSGQSVVVPSTRVSSPFFMRPQAAFDPSQILTAEYFRNLLTPAKPLAMQKGGSVIDAAAERFLGSLRAA